MRSFFQANEIDDFYENKRIIAFFTDRRNEYLGDVLVGCCRDVQRLDVTRKTNPIGAAT